MRLRLCATAIAALAPACASAHEASEGLAGLVEGAAQLVLYPNLTFALVVGALGASAMRRSVLPTSAAALVLGCLAGCATPPFPAILWLIPALLGTVGGIGAALVASARMPRPIAELLALALGWGTGLATVPTHGSALAVTVSLLGSIGGALIGVGLLAAALAAGRGLLGDRIGAIALRVVGAWVVAIAVLMLALHLAPPAEIQL